MPTLNFSRGEFQRRDALVQAAMTQAGLDVLIAYSVKNDPGPVVYLSGFESSLGLHDVAFFVIAPGSNPSHTLVTNAFWDHPDQRTWVDSVMITNQFGPRLAEILPPNAKRIGIAGYNFFPTPVFRALQAAFPSAEFVDFSRTVEELTIVKSDEEVAVVRRCVEMTDAGGRAFLEHVRAGVNEREVKAEVERAIMRAGSEAYWYNFQLFAGPQVAYGMGGMTGRTIAEGEQVQVDCGALYCGYRGDFSRVTTIGKPSPAVEKVMETTAEMYEAMLNAIRPGVAIADVANAAWAAAEKRGMGEFYYRSPNPPTDKRGFVGHGMGSWTHSLPTLDPDAKGELRANTVLVFEPILSQIGVGGAKIEDSILVTQNGAERLSKIDIRSWRNAANGA